MKVQRSAIPYIEALFAVVVWGASFIATKLALRDVSPATVVWLRFAMGVAILGAFTAARREFALPGKSELAYFTLLGFLGIAFHQWLQSTGLVTAQATTTAWIVATTPVFIAILGWLFLKEGLGWVQVMGILFAGTGVLLVVSKGDLASLTFMNFGTSGDLLILFSAPNWAVFSILSRRGLQKHPPARMMFFVMSIGWLLSTTLFLIGPGLGELPHLSLPGWIGIAFLGIFCSGLAYIAWYDALQSLPASQVGVFLYIEPLVAVIVAGILLGERVSLLSLLGGGTILLGVFLVNRSKPAKPAASS